MAFRDGILVFSQPGALPAKALDQVIAAVAGTGHGRGPREGRRGDGGIGMTGMTGSGRRASYAMTVTVDRPFDETLSATREALADQGFGVLTEIDMQATLKAKLGVDIAPQVILGACRHPGPRRPPGGTVHRPAAAVQRRGPRPPATAPPAWRR